MTRDHGTCGQHAVIFDANVPEIHSSLPVFLDSILTVQQQYEALTNHSLHACLFPPCQSVARTGTGSRSQLYQRRLSCRCAC